MTVSLDNISSFIHPMNSIHSDHIKHQRSFDDVDKCFILMLERGLVHECLVIASRSSSLSPSILAPVTPARQNADASSLFSLRHSQIFYSRLRLPVKRLDSKSSDAVISIFSSSMLGTKKTSSLHSKILLTFITTMSVLMSSLTVSCSPVLKRMASLYSRICNLGSRVEVIPLRFHSSLPFLIR